MSNQESFLLSKISNLIKFEIVYQLQRENKEYLFREALASTQRGYVLYVSQNEITDIPSVPSCSRHYLKMLTLLYLKTSDALIEGLLTLPEWQNVPATIVLDGLNGYCSGKSKQNACGIVSLLMDTARSCSRVLNVQCKVILSIDRETQSEDICGLIKELYCQLN